LSPEVARHRQALKGYNEWSFSLPTNKKKKKLNGLQSTSELYRLSDCHLLVRFSADFCG
jgi:hypothetical protein